MTTISVLVPHYNHTATVSRAVESALGEQVGGVEVVLVDDGSTEPTGEVFDALRARWGERIRILHHSENRGVHEAMNTAAAAARGRYCIQLDADDWLEPGCLKPLAAVLDARAEVGFVYGNSEMHGLEQGMHSPPGFAAEDFYRTFACWYAYLWRREIWAQGARYVAYFERCGRWWSLYHWDFVLQMIEAGWMGHKVETTVLHYQRNEQGEWSRKKHHRRDLLRHLAARFPQAKRAI